MMEMIRNFPAIIRIVSFGGKPSPVDDGEIAVLQQVVNSKRDANRFPYMTAGLKVKVISGPLGGITGVITQVKKRDRLVVSVDVIMNSVCVDIDRSEVQPLA